MDTSLNTGGAPKSIQAQGSPAIQFAAGTASESPIRTALQLKESFLTPRDNSLLTLATLVAKRKEETSVLKLMSGYFTFRKERNALVEEINRSLPKGVKPQSSAALIKEARLMKKEQEALAKATQLESRGELNIPKDKLKDLEKRMSEFFAKVSYMAPAYRSDKTKISFHQEEVAALQKELEEIREAFVLTDNNSIENPDSLNSIFVNKLNNLIVKLEECKKEMGDLSLNIQGETLNLINEIIDLPENAEKEKNAAKEKHDNAQTELKTYRESIKPPVKESIPP